MKPPIICDMCAEPISQDNVVAVHLHNVMMAKARTVMRQRFMEIYSETERIDEFHLCQECGGHLSLALHQSRQGIKIAVCKLEDQS